MSTETLDITEARAQINKLDERLKDEMVIRVTRHNKEVFAIVDIEYLATILETIEILSDPKSHELYLQSLDDLRNGRVHDQDDVRRELGL